MSYPFTLYTRPNGHSSEDEMTEIKDEDAEFLRQHNVKISMEDCGAFYCIWADDGTMMEDDPSTPDEITYIVPRGQSCQDAMSAVCRLVRKRIEA